jgi:DNA-binding response OmpR family regulator
MAILDPTILLVEVDADLRDTVSELMALFGLGFASEWARWLNAKAQAALARRCSLAILDINLGEGAPSGVDMCRWLVQLGFPVRAANAPTDCSW